MIADLKPYPEYKESGSKWLGAVPVTWVVRNLRTLISKRVERNRVDLPLLSVAREKGVFVRSLIDADENHNVIPEDLSNYKVAHAGNLVINKMKAWQGSMGIAPCDGIVSPAYFVFDFRIEDHAFGQRLLRSKPYVAHFAQASDGVRVGQWDLSIPGMRQIPVLVPPPDEQTAIVRFLDWANGRLERAIRAKRKVIGLLNEQKEAIIRRTVTRGLDPSVPVKPSGIAWLGDIPQNWEVKPLKRLIANGTTISYGIVQPGDHAEGGVAFLQTTNISKPQLHAQSLQRTTEAIAAAYPRTQLKAGDVILGIRASIGAAHVVPQELAGVNLSRGIARIVPSADVSPEYLVQFLRSRASGSYWEYARQGTTFNEVAISAVRELPVVVPPAREQAALVSRTQEMCGPSDTAICRLNREIELLREYRSRLVEDVVTGKLNVREAAARLPDEAPLDSVEDAPDVSDETEAADEEATA